MTLSGYLLGKSTKEEHKEIRKYVRIICESLIVITYLILIYYFYNNILAPFFIAGLVIMKVSSRFTLLMVDELHNVGLFGVTFLFFYNLGNMDLVYYSLLPMLVLLLSNSMVKFSLKEEVYKFFFVFAIFLVLGL